MELKEILIIIFFLGVSIISYYLKQTMNDIKDISDKHDELELSVHRSNTKLEVIENDYINKVNNLDDKFNLLYKSIDKLSNKIDKLIDKI